MTSAAMYAANTVTGIGRALKAGAAKFSAERGRCPKCRKLSTDKVKGSTVSKKNGKGALVVYQKVFHCQNSSCELYGKPFTIVLPVD